MQMHLPPGHYKSKCSLCALKRLRKPQQAPAVLASSFSPPRTSPPGFMGPSPEGPRSPALLVTVGVPHGVTRAGDTPLEMDGQSRLGSPAQCPAFPLLQLQWQGDIPNSIFPGRLRAAPAPSPCHPFTQPCCSRQCHGRRTHAPAPLLMLNCWANNTK